MDNVTITATPANLINSIEPSGLRVDGRDSCVQMIPATVLKPTAGRILWAWTPRHSDVEAVTFDIPAWIMRTDGGANNYIDVVWNNVNNLRLQFNANGAGIQIGNWATGGGAIVPDTTYQMEVRYGTAWMRLYIDGVLRITINAPTGFTWGFPIPHYWGSTDTIISHVDSTFAAPTAPLPPPNGLLNNLIAYWPGDEAAGNLIDAHTNGLHLTDNNTVTSNPGQVYATARQYTFANSEYHSRASEALLQMGDIDFTLAAWVYLDDKLAGHQIISKYETALNQREYYLSYAGGADRFQLVVDSFGTGGAGTGVVSANTLGSPSVTTWYLIIAWHDAVSNEIRIMVNNGVSDSVAHATGVHVDISPFHLGAFGRAALGFFWSGRLNPSMMWKSAAGGGGVLSSSQRSALWNSGNGLPYSSFTA